MADYYLDQPSRPIELNPAHKGKFTEWCLRHGFKSVQEGAKHVLANKQHYPEEVVKMATFAHNSKQWGKGDRSAPKSRKDRFGFDEDHETDEQERYEEDHGGDNMEDDRA